MNESIEKERGKEADFLLSSEEEEKVLNHEVEIVYDDFWTTPAKNPLMPVYQ